MAFSKVFSPELNSNNIVTSKIGGTFNRSVKCTLDNSKYIQFDIGWGSVCFDFRSTNIVQLSSVCRLRSPNYHRRQPVTEPYLWGILGQWDILLLNLTSIGFTNFFRCLIFDLSFFTNADVVTIKDETSK